MTQAIEIATDDTLSPVRALNSLPTVQADQIVAGLSALAAAWSIERHESCDGQLSLLLTHVDHDTTVIVDRDHTGINVSLMLGDEIYSTTKHRVTIEDAPTAIRVIKSMAVSPVTEAQRHSA